MRFQEDQEVMELVGEISRSPQEKGDVRQPKKLNVKIVLDIHRYMTEQLRNIVKEFTKLPQASRHSFTAKGCETTAELLVSIAVEKKFNVVSRDVENALCEFE